MRNCTRILCVICLAFFASEALGENSITPGELIQEAPTVVCLGVRWLIAGDDNRNASVRVQYRPDGQEEWQEGLPLFRVKPEGIPLGRKAPNMFAGSIFDLIPGTVYQVKLTMSDPDGGGGEKTVRMRTRPVPPYTSSKVRILPAGVIGPISLTSGTPDDPVIYRGSTDGETIIDGRGGRVAVNASGCKYAHIENVTIRNAHIGVQAEDSAVGIVVRRCRIERCKQGIYNTNRYNFGRDFYISDNVIIGPYRWPKTGIFSEEGIQVCGHGHVVCYNRIYGWSDGISILDQRGAWYPCRAFDYYNNDISECTDDGIEMDTGEYNIRAFRNRITNSHTAITNQPIYGGPCYIFRNVIYNITASPFKLHVEPSGLLVFHNTVIRAGNVGGKATFLHYSPAPVKNAHFYNNLFLGNGERAIESWGDFIGCSMDYNGYTRGGVAFTKDGMKVETPGLRGFIQKTGLEKHSTVLDLSIFAQRVAFPNNVKSLHKPPDLRLRDGSAAIDRGVVLSNMNDGFRGAAPDLGAYEFGEALPHYGPRPKGMDEATEAAKRKPKAPAIEGVTALAPTAPTSDKKGELSTFAQEIAAAQAKAKESNYADAAAILRQAKEKAEGEAREALAEMALALASAKDMRAWIIKGVTAGRSEKIQVTLMGMRMRARLADADDDGVTALVAGTAVPVSWKELGPGRFLSTAKVYAAPAGQEPAADRARLLAGFEHFLKFGTEE